MIRNFNRITLLIVWLSYLSLCKEVRQVPPAILGHLHGSATISCSHSISSYDTILWYQQSMGDSELKLIGHVFYRSSTIEKPFSHDSFNVIGDGSKEAVLHVLTLRHPDSGMYYCTARTASFSEVYFGAGTKLTVLEANRTITPPTVKVLPPSQNECQNSKDKKNKNNKNKKTLVCVASRFYPDHVSVFWQIDGENVTDGVATDNTALWGGEHYSITSRLRVPLRKWFTPGKNFTCTVSFFNGTVNVHRYSWVNGVEGPGAGAVREKYLRITHTAKLSYAVLIIKSSIYGAFVVFLVWRLQGSSGKQNN